MKFIKRIRAIGRMAYLAIYTMFVVCRILIVSAIRGYSPEYSMKQRRIWAIHLLKAIGVRIVRDGVLPIQPCLILCNHRSYLDPVIILTDVLAYPVSKAEVANWPVLGYGAKVTGVLFLKRESVSSRKNTLSAIADTIKGGWPIILFPEGTTYDTPETGPLKRGGFQLAAQENLPIVPVALEYGEKEDCWVGNATFVPHFLDRFGEKRVYTRIRYGIPITNSDPNILMDETKAWIDTQLAEFQIEKDWRIKK